LLVKPQKNVAAHDKLPTCWKYTKSWYCIYTSTNTFLFKKKSSILV